MGEVMLEAVVTSDGRATDIQIVRDPGMGLGEKAVEAVRTWQLSRRSGRTARQRRRDS